MIDLKATDVEMLKILLTDGRTSFMKIAQEVGVSKDIVMTRYRELLKAGLIVGSTAQINYQILGYTGIATLLLRVNSQNIPDTFNRISKIPNIPNIEQWLFRVYGSSYNIGIIFVLKNLRDLEQIKQLIYRQNKITSSQTYIWMDLHNTPENIFKNPAENEPLADQNIKHDANHGIDKFDNEIIEILSANGRLPFSKIAEKPVCRHRQ